jgi:hypothetical protein
VLHTYLVYNTVVRLTGCVSFLVVAGNSSQNENKFLQKNLIGLFFYDLLANVCTVGHNQNTPGVGKCKMTVGLVL